MRSSDHDQFGGWVEMTKRTADGATVACLAVADVLDRLMHQRTLSLHQTRKCEIALPRHGADLKRFVRLAYVG
jgi:hypothetical protein